MLSAEQRRRLREGSEIIRYPDARRAIPDDFLKGPVVLFIHGFMADARNMTRLMKQFVDNDYVALAFNYACFDGIDVAARNLNGLLATFDLLANGHLARNRLVIVGHSMGGLVARAFVALEQGDRYAKKVITFGSPHDGTFALEHLDIALYLSEWLAGIWMGGYSPTCRSALQLTRCDADKLLDKLKTVKPDHGVEFISFSGGKPVLEVGGGIIANYLLNNRIQFYYKDVPNDGLIAETSSDLSQAIFATCAPNCVHWASYPEYATTNHTNLVTNATLGLQAVGFAKDAPRLMAQLHANAPTGLH